MNASKHFTIKELRCKCRRCDVGQRVEDYDPDLLARLDATRDRYGHPIFVVSGARCPDWNTHEGGKPNSAHLPDSREGHPQFKKVRAVDVQGIGSRNRFNILEAAILAGFRRIGIARTFIHLDTAWGEPYDQDVIWLYA